MTAIEVVSDLSVELSRVRDMALWVATAPAPEAADMADKAAQARQIIKAMKGAAALALEASRLECLALRRVGLLGQASLAGRKANIAREFAAMSELEFEALMGGLGPWSGAHGAYRKLCSERLEQDSHAEGGAVASGKAAHPIGCKESLHELTQAAAALLDDYADDGGPVSIAEVADRIADDLGIVRYCHDAATRAGLAEAVRLALHRGDGSDDGPHPDAPKWVTYQDDRAGWVRIPFRTASVEQFRAMVELRREQVAQLRSVVERLESVLVEVSTAEKIYPGESCGDLLRWHGEAVAS